MMSVVAHIPTPSAPATPIRPVPIVADPPPVRKGKRKRRCERSSSVAGSRSKRRLYGQRLSAADVDAMPARYLIHLFGNDARENVVVLDGDQVVDVVHDEQVTSEWFENNCANCGLDRNNDEDYYDPDDHESQLVVHSCFWCRIHETATAVFSALAEDPDETLINPLEVVQA